MFMGKMVQSYKNIQQYNICYIGCKRKADRTLGWLSSFQAQLVIV